jgi:hypothetical protein
LSGLGDGRAQSRDAVEHAAEIAEILRNWTLCMYCVGVLILGNP